MSDITFVTYFMSKGLTATTKIQVYSDTISYCYVKYSFNVQLTNIEKYITN